jgi:acetylornithine deacetylase
MDMKASLAACLVAVAAASTRDLAGDVILTAVADEEHDSIGTRETLAALTGGTSGAALKIDAAIVTEPSDLDVHVAHRGFALFEVELEGVASHTSQPEKGVNALVHLGRLLSAVEELDLDLRRRRPHSLVAHGSLQPVLARGGHELFTTPNHAAVTLERRTLPGETEEAVRNELQELLDRLIDRDATVKANMKTLVAREPFEAQAGAEIERLLVSAVAAERGAPPTLLGAPYWTDAALIAAVGIPTLLFGPIGGGIHQPGEWVDLDSVHVMTRVLGRVIDEFCG